MYIVIKSHIKSFSYGQKGESKLQTAGYPAILLVFNDYHLLIPVRRWSLRRRVLLSFVAVRRLWLLQLDIVVVAIVASVAGLVGWRRVVTIVVVRLLLLLVAVRWLSVVCRRAVTCRCSPECPSRAAVWRPAVLSASARGDAAGGWVSAPKHLVGNGLHLREQEEDEERADDDQRQHKPAGPVVPGAVVAAHATERVAVAVVASHVVSLEVCVTSRGMQWLEGACREEVI